MSNTVLHIFDLSSLEAETGGSLELKVSLFYIVSSRQPGIVQWNSLSKQGKREHENQGCRDDSAV